MLSSVSLTSESSASVRSSKGKLQLDVVSPSKRIHLERKSAICFCVCVYHGRWNNFIVLVIGDRPVLVYIFYQILNSLSNSWFLIILSPSTFHFIKTKIQVQIFFPQYSRLLKQNTNIKKILSIFIYVFTTFIF